MADEKTQQILKHFISYLSSERFLKHLPKNISAILTISDVSILRLGYMLSFSPEHSGGRDRSNYSQIHIKFINQDYWISRISQSILNQFSWNFTHTIFHSCRDYPENLAKFR